MWKVISGKGSAHVMPMEDDKPHVVVGCWCKPTKMKTHSIYIHHSADKRELYEHQEQVRVLPN